MGLRDLAIRLEQLDSDCPSGTLLAALTEAAFTPKPKERLAAGPVFAEIVRRAGKLGVGRDDLRLSGSLSISLTDWDCWSRPPIADDDIPAIGVMTSVVAAIKTELARKEAPVP